MPYFKVLSKLKVQTYYQSFVFEVVKVIVKMCVKVKVVNVKQYDS